MVSENEGVAVELTVEEMDSVGVYVDEMEAVEDTVGDAVGVSVTVETVWLAVEVTVQVLVGVREAVPEIVERVKEMVEVKEGVGVNVSDAVGLTVPEGVMEDVTLRDGDKVGVGVQVTVPD